MRIKQKYNWKICLQKNINNDIFDRRPLYFLNFFFFFNFSFAFISLHFFIIIIIIIKLNYIYIYSISHSGRGGRENEKYVLLDRTPINLWRNKKCRRAKTIYKTDSHWRDKIDGELALAKNRPEKTKLNWLTPPELE